MTWPKIVLIMWLGIGALITIAQTGKARKPLEPSVVAVSTLLTAAIIALVVIA